MLVMRKGLLLVSKHYLLSGVLGLNKTTVMALENERNRPFFPLLLFFSQVICVSPPSVTQNNMIAADCVILAVASTIILTTRLQK